jgi:hypothetical protein
MAICQPTRICLPAIAHPHKGSAGLATVKQFHNNHIELILKYRAESLSDTRNTYPRQDQPRGTNMFLATSSAPMVTSIKQDRRLALMQPVPKLLVLKLGGDNELVTRSWALGQ